LAREGLGFQIFRADGKGPGRHSNCETVHCYVQTPGGFAIEFGYGHRRLDDAMHQPVTYPAGTPVDV
jgi:hypothetical protein